MLAHLAPSRPVRLARSLSWPLYSHGSRSSAIQHHSSTSTAAQLHFSNHTTHVTSCRRLFDDDNDVTEQDLDQNPDAHCLPPMDSSREYWMDWSDEDDSDDGLDDDQVGWNAGIMDFTLFQKERYHATETQQDLSPQWQSLLSSQKSALERAAHRTQTLPHLDDDAFRPTFLRDQDVPDLTPDNSPDLRGHLANAIPIPIRKRAADHSALSSAKADPLHIIVTLPSDSLHRSSSAPTLSSSDLALGDFAPASPIDTTDEEASSLIPPPTPKILPMSKPELHRPGLRGSRTLSGKMHAWRPPSICISTVREESDAEEEDSKANLRLTTA